ncbi:MAG: YicC family protein [Firmicutes bacterium]|nr:YicC family protein [Bacillota bacterium]
MAYSMTGYGRGESLGQGISCIVEMRSVNHRYRDILVRVPRELLEFEDKLRRLVAEHFDRGRIDISVTLGEAGESLSAVKTNRSLVDSYMSATRQLAHDLGLSWDLGINGLISLPGVMELTHRQVDSEEMWRLMEQSALQAMIGLKEMRAKEGAFLARDIVGRTKLIEGLIEQIRERAPRVIEDYRMRLEARLAELLGDTSVDESRIVMEAAFYADRSDITEELVRLGSHSVQIYEVVRQDEPIGRRLEFLVQEMQREVNTIGSKAQDSDISHRVVDIKSELEKIREQIQNIE